MEATDMKSVEKNIVSVALADIQPSNYNPRKTFDEASLAELAESIRQQGVLQPIGVRPIGEIALKLSLANADTVHRSWQDWKPSRQSYTKCRTR